MWLKSHRWVDVPGTRTEKRLIMNVRESSHTAMVFDKKYLNVETGKFDTDRLCTLNSLSLNDLVEDAVYQDNCLNAYVRRAKRDNEEISKNVYNFPKHVPKDNDFDAEIEREKRQKEWIAQQEVMRIEEEAVRKRHRDAYWKGKEDNLRNVYAKKLQEAEERQIKLKKDQEEYAKKLAEVEERLIRENNERRERLKQAGYLRHLGNVMPNVWRPK
jgi:hypothetical protein